MFLSLQLVSPSVSKMNTTDKQNEHIGYLLEVHFVVELRLSLHEVKTERGNEKQSDMRVFCQEMRVRGVTMMDNKPVLIEHDHRKADNLHSDY